MTPIEAAIRGVPVISTKETSHYKVKMGLVNYVDDPRDERELVDMMLKILHENKEEDYMICLDITANVFKDEYRAEKIATQYYELLMKVDNG